MLDIGLMVFFLFIIALETIFIFEPYGWISFFLGLFGFLFAVYSAIGSFELPAQPWFSLFVIIWSIFLMLRSADAI